MLTFFTVPKAFIGHIGVIQENAIRSWRSVQPNSQILLFGNEAGTADVCARLGLTHLKDTETNSYGTPLLDDVFRRAQELASFPTVCYVNTDIILPPTFGLLPPGLSLRPFLLIGQRWDLNVTVPLDMSDANWFDQLREDVAVRGRMHEPSGSDYFLFRRGDTVGELLPFAVGRPGWDNWMIYHAHRQHVPVIDATLSWQVVHQNHDYSHVPKRREDSWEGPEADENRGLLESNARLFTLSNATHILRAGSVQRRFDPAFLKAALRSRMVAAATPRQVGRWLFALSARVKRRLIFGPGK